jgi:hypothetical protein
MKTEKQQTAVEWLVEQLTEGNYNWKVYEEAKEMEKEHMIDFVDNLIVGMSREKIEQYYNETFNKSINNKG